MATGDSEFGEGLFEGTTEEVAVKENGEFVKELEFNLMLKWFVVYLGIWVRGAL